MGCLLNASFNIMLEVEFNTWLLRILSVRYETRADVAIWSGENESCGNTFTPNDNYLRLPLFSSRVNHTDL